MIQANELAYQDARIRQHMNMQSRMSPPAQVMRESDFMMQLANEESSTLISQMRSN